MSAYVIVFAEEITDAEAIGEYRRIGLPTLIEHKPDVLLRMAAAETLEGPQVNGGVVLLRFPTMEAAKAWYDSPAYQEALTHRFRGARCHAVMAEDPSPA